MRCIQVPQTMIKVCVIAGCGEVTKKPPLCPFCRNFIEGFHALQLTD